MLVVFRLINFTEHQPAEPFNWLLFFDLHSCDFSALTLLRTKQQLKIDLIIIFTLSYLKQKKLYPYYLLKTFSIDYCFCLTLFAHSYHIVWLVELMIDYRILTDSQNYCMLSYEWPQIMQLRKTHLEKDSPGGTNTCLK